MALRYFGCCLGGNSHGCSDFGARRWHCGGMAPNHQRFKCQIELRDCLYENENSGNNQKGITIRQQLERLNSTDKSKNRNNNGGDKQVGFAFTTTRNSTAATTPFHDTEPYQMCQEKCAHQPKNCIDQNSAKADESRVHHEDNFDDKVNDQRGESDPQVHQRPLLETYVMLLHCIQLAWHQQFSPSNVLVRCFYKAEILFSSVQPKFGKFNVEKCERALAHAFPARSLVLCHGTGMTSGRYSSEIWLVFKAKK